MAARLTLGRGDLREGVVEAFSRVVTHAIEMARRVEDDPVTAVHEWRRALRRARALVRLVQPVSEAGPWRALAKDLRRAHRAASGFRDIDVARTAGMRLTGDAARQAVLQKEARRLAALPRRFERALGEPDVEALGEGLEKSYRRMRRAEREARRTGAPEDVHEWRKRAKEVAYQLELLATRPECHAGRLRKEYGRLATELGLVTDAETMRRLVVERRGGLDTAKRRALAAVLEKKRDLGLARALELADGIGDEPPRRFARRVLR